MRQRIKYIWGLSILIVIISLIFVINAGAYSFGWSRESGSKIEDKGACIIIKYKSQNESVNFEGIKNRENLTDDVELIELSNPENIENILETLNADSCVVSAQPNHLLRAAELQTDEDFVQQTSDNDISTKNIDINIEKAWEITKGSNNITVGVLDTGINVKHPELRGAIRGDGFNFVDNNDKINDYQEEKHGTAISGIIAGKHDEDGVRGVANGVKILPLKFMENYTGYTSDAIKAINYAAEKNVDIINCSFYSDENNLVLKDVMANANILFVCAAGNRGRNSDIEPLYPASYDLKNIISVGSINSEGKISPFSNYGHSVDVLAPGEEINSTSVEDEYYSYSGTSISAAYVSGVAALIKSNKPDMSVEDIADTIKNSVRRFSDYENKVGCSGIVDAYAALSNDIAPISDMKIFEAFENDKFESLDSNIEAYSSETEDITFFAGGEIEPIVAQNVHYGESGVNPASGNFSFSIKDFEDSAPGMNFIFERYYNSLDQDREKAFGCGWSSVLDSKVKKINNRTFSITLPNGSSHKFTGNGSVYTSNTTRDTLTRDSSTQFTLTTKDQMKYIFSSPSSNRPIKLTEIKDKTDNTVLKILYDNQNCFASGILDSVGRKYTITYSTEQNEGFNVSSITDPYGRTVYYDYTSSSFMSILTSFVDIMGNTTSYLFWQKDYAPPRRRKFC